MRLLILLHRWLGIGTCALFTMWFASGIVMHLVPFPSLTETERVSGLAPIDAARVRQGAADALRASGMSDATRMRLMQRPDGPVYVISGPTKTVALRADDLADARVTSGNAARAMALAHAQHRGLEARRSADVGLAMHDQWTVPNGYDPHRPLYRIALNDPDGTDLYVSSATGEIVQNTTRFQRGWNYAGSVVHWIYPTLLRSNWAAWDRTVWTVALIAMIGALTGVALGLLRLRRTARGLRSPFRGWQAWHHILGLVCASFVMTWIVSGWLSMDHGRLFSRGMSATESASLSPPLTADHLATIDEATTARDIEWFTLGDASYRRDRMSPDRQTVGTATDRTSFLSPDHIVAALMRVAPDCDAPIVVRSDDAYPATAIISAAPVYRVICGDVWFHIDGASGGVIERLDASRRAYRWAYAGLHTLNIPMLTRQPALRSTLIIGLCLAGLIFSITGTLIGWRWLRRQF